MLKSAGEMILRMEITGSRLHPKGILRSIGTVSVRSFMWPQTAWHRCENYMHQLICVVQEPGRIAHWWCMAGLPNSWHRYSFECPSSNFARRLTTGSNRSENQASGIEYWPTCPQITLFLVRSTPIIPIAGRIHILGAHLNVPPEYRTSLTW